MLTSCFKRARSGQPKKRGNSANDNVQAQPATATRRRSEGLFCESHSQLEAWSACQQSATRRRSNTHSTGKALWKERRRVQAEKAGNMLAAVCLLWCKDRQEETFEA
jgi:hypothetical protein